MNNKYDIYWVSSENLMLRSVTIELLTKCNWKCEHCYIPSHNNQGMTKEIIFKLFDQCRKLGVIQLTLTGGEIFLRDDILEIITEARKRYFQVILLTNVSLLNEEIIKCLSQLYLKKISCTLFSMDPKIHDEITGVSGSWNSAMSNIKLLKKYNIPLEIKTVLMKKNALEYRKLRKYCKQNDISYQATTIVSGKNDGDMSPADLRVADTDLEKYIKEMEPKLQEKIYNEKEYVCRTVRFSLDINCCGDIFPCNVYHGTKPLGNIYEDSLEKIWYESDALHKIQNMKYEDLGECNKCKFKLFCYKCPGITLLENEDIYGKSELACTHAEVRYRINERRE